MADAGGDLMADSVEVQVSPALACLGRTKMAWLARESWGATLTRLRYFDTILDRKLVYGIIVY